MSKYYDVKAVLSAEDRGFTSAFKRATGATDTLGAKLKSGIGFGIFAGIGQGAVNKVANGIRNMTASVGEAVNRVDTLNNFPKIMENIGYGTDEASAAIKKMDKGIQGLPTSMDAIASATTKIAPLTGSLGKATDVTLALNNALLAGGKSTEVQSNALEQFSQMLSLGKVDMQAWRSMVTAMPGKLDQLAVSLLGAGKGNMDLYKAMQSGEVTFSDFNNELVKLNKNGVKGFASFSEQAKTATGGIKTQMTNLHTSVVRGLANTISAADQKLKVATGKGIADRIASLKSKIDSGFKKISGSETFQKVVVGIGSALKTVGKIAVAFGRAIGKLAGAFVDIASKGSVLGKFLRGVSKLFIKFAGFVENHATGIAQAATAVLAFMAAFKGYRMIQSAITRIKEFASGVQSFVSTFAESARQYTAVQKAMKTEDGFEALQLLQVKATSTGGAFAGLASKLGLSTTALGGIAAAGVAAAVGIGYGIYKLATRVNQYTAAYNKAHAARQKAINSQMAEGQVLSTYESRLNSLMGKEKKSAANKAEIKSIVDKLNETIPGLSLKYDAEKDALNRSTEAIHRKIAAYKQEAMALAYKTQMEDAANKLVEDRIELQKLEKKREGMNPDSARIGGVDADIKALKESIKSGNADMNGFAQNIENLNDKSQAAWSKMVQKATDAGVKVPKAFKEGIEAGQYKPVQSLNAMYQLMDPKYKEAVATAKASFGKIPAEIKNAISTGKMKPSEAIELINNLCNKELDIGANKAGTNGKKTASKYASGINGGKGSARTAGAGLASAANSGASQSGIFGSSRGGAFAQGFINGISALIPSVGPVAALMVNAANIATSKTQKDGSPSKLAKKRGKYWGQGYVLGILGENKSAGKAGAGLAFTADSALCKEAEIHSPSKKAKRRGVSYAVGFGNGMASGIKAVVKQAKSLVNATGTIMKGATKNSIWSHDFTGTAEKALSKLKSSLDKKVSAISKSLTKRVSKVFKSLKKNAGSKKLKNIYAKAEGLLKGKYGKAIKAEASKIMSAAKSSLNKLAKTYQAKYDAIISAKNTFVDNLKDYGSLYTSDTYGFVAFTDFKAATNQISKIKSNLEKLKKAGVSLDFLNQITSMDAASQLQYTNMLLSKGNAFIKQQSKDYAEFIKTAGSAGTSVYSSYIKNLDADYNKELKKVLKKLKNQFNAIGKNSAKGLVAGLQNKSTRKALNAAAGGLANTIIKQIKKKLKIHSPSRVFDNIGSLSGQGLVNGLASMAGKVASAAQNLVSIPQMAVADIGGNFNGELNNAYEYSKQAEYTIVVPVEYNGKEIARVTASFTEAELNKRQTRASRKRGSR